MHICFMSRVVLEHGDFGGMQIHGDLVLRGLASRGARIDVITTARGPKGIDGDRPGVRFHFLESCPATAYGETYFAESLRRLEELHAKDPVDLVIGQSGGAFGYVRNGNRRRLSIPVVAFLHGSARWEMMARWQSARSPREWAGAAKAVVAMLRERFGAANETMPEYDAVLAVSNELAAGLRLDFPAAAPRIVAVLNGIDENRFRPDPSRRRELRARLALSGSDLVVMQSGKIFYRKGISFGLEAIGQLWREGLPVRMLVAGSGPDEAEMKALAHSLGIAERILFCGYVPNGEIDAYYNACDLFLMPSLYWEGMPLAIIEALACGKPVVASSTGGIPSAVLDGVTGRLVPSRDSVALAAAIREFLSNPARLAEAGAAARRDVCARLTIGHMLDRTYRLLGRIAAGHPPEETTTSTS